MKKIYLLVLYFTLISVNAITSNCCAVEKPNYFPQKAVNVIMHQLSNTNRLDTIDLIETDYTDLLEVKQESKSGEFKPITDVRIIELATFAYVKNMLHLLYELEENLENEDLKQSFIFKLEVELKNKPLSMKDLSFAYQNWHLNERKD